MNSMRYGFYGLCLMLTAGLSACVSERHLLKPTGDPVTLLLHDREQVKGELLAVDDTTIYVFRDDAAPGTSGQSRRSILSVSAQDVQTITVGGYRNTYWRPAAVVFGVVPAILLGIAAQQEDASGAAVALVFSIPTALAAIILQASTPSPPRFEPLSFQLRAMRKYARFPQGLAAAQLDQLLQINGQPEIQRLEAAPPPQVATGD